MVLFPNGEFNSALHNSTGLHEQMQDFGTARHQGWVKRIAAGYISPPKKYLTKQFDNLAPGVHPSSP